MSGAAAGWSTYCLDQADYVSGNQLFVTAGNTVTFQAPGLYRVSFRSIAMGTPNVYMARLMKNGLSIQITQQPPNANWFEGAVGGVWPFAAGDSLQVQVQNPGSYAYLQGPQYSHLQIEYVGRL